MGSGKPIPSICTLSLNAMLRNKNSWMARDRRKHLPAPLHYNFYS